MTLVEFYKGFEDVKAVWERPLVLIFGINMWEGLPSPDYDFQGQETFPTKRNEGLGS